MSSQRLPSESDGTDAGSPEAARERELLGVIQALPDGVVICRDGAIVFANDAFSAWLGWSEDQLRGVVLRELVHASDRSKPLGPGQLRFLHQKGHELIIDVTPARGIWFEGERAHLIAFRDVTEQKRMQVQLMAADRAASVGLLAAGMAHEINNPLAAVTANLEMAMREVDALVRRVGPLDELTEELEDARSAAERVRLLVRDLKLFSRTEADRRELIDVNRLLDSTVRMAWNEIRHRAQVIKDYSEVPLVEANESRLGQVFLNLVVNAAQAIRGGGSDRNSIRISTASDGQSISIEVTDTGVGMEPEVLERLFTPFFTTKPIGQGTGLGLAMSQGIIAGLGGQISVDSAPGQGARFRVVLPASERARRSVAAGTGQGAGVWGSPRGTGVGPPLAALVETLGAGSAAAAGASRGVSGGSVRSGRILAVDDDPLILGAMQRALEEHHEVVAVDRAELALEQIVRGERFDVILCDLVMPRMTGEDLHRELERLAPDQARAMVFLTGGAFTLRAREFLDGVPNLRLQKPFGEAQLSSLVDRCVLTRDEREPAPERGAGGAQDRLQQPGDGD